MFINNLISILLSFICTNIFLPRVIKFGYKFKLTDEPDKRKIHKTAKVHLGGIAIIIGFFISILISSLIYFFYYDFGISNFKILFVLLISFLYFLIGVIDDIYNLSPIKRLILQFVLAYFVWFSGFGVNNLDLSIFFDEQKIIFLPKILSLLITQFWIVGIINAINWLDGLDGLAGSISLISFVAYFFIAFNYGQYLYCLIASCLIGTTLAFLKYNKFPSLIMMGDGGSYFYGFYLAILGLITPLSNNQNFQFYIPLIILFIPLTDMILVISKRIYQKKSPFYPDRNHLHHRIMRRGLNSKQTVLLIFLASLVPLFLVLMILTY